MALMLSPPFVSSLPPLLSPTLSRHGTERLVSLRCSPGRGFSVARQRRTLSSVHIQEEASSIVHIQEEASSSNRSASAAALHKQSRNSSTSRRRLLVLLLSSGLTLARTNLAAAASDVGFGPPSPPSVGITDEIQEKDKGIEGPIMGDLFGFDGLGKASEEYALGKVVALAQAGDGAVLFLGVDGFELPLQLVVGPAEAMAVLTAVQERKSRRPVTHEAWGLSLAAVGWKVDRVLITGNEKDVFYSSIVLSNLSQLLSNPSGVKKSVDMRPSDGIALALRCRAPLFVRRKIVEDLLGPKADLAGKVKKVDPLKQPGLKANSGASPIFVENLVSALGERKLQSPLLFSWMRRLQSFQF